MKNCPECGRQHRSINTTMECMSPIQFRINWIIIIGDEEVPKELKDRQEKMKEFMKPLHEKFKIKMKAQDQKWMEEK